MPVGNNQVDDDSNADPGYITENYYPSGAGSDTADPAYFPNQYPSGTGSDTADPGYYPNQSTTNSTSNPGRPGKRLNNPLSKLASYTYNISLYMITPDAYAAFVANGRKNIDMFVNTNITGNPSGVKPGAYLLAQSGGINNQTTQRAPGFDTDFYIDNLRFKTLTGTHGTGTNTPTVTNIDFQITEPYGFSFLTKLKNAADILKQYNDKNATYKHLSNQFKQIYILGIRFYGYSVTGKLIKSGTDLYGEPIDPAGQGALFENFYDMQITNVKFRLDGKSVVYNIHGVSINAQALLGIKRGRLETGANVVGSNVHQMLTGLINKLNEDEEKKVKAGNATSPNIYNVKYVGTAKEKIGNASVVTLDDLTKNLMPAVLAQNTAEASIRAGQGKPNTTLRTYTFNNDTSIVQAIEQIIKKSSYIINSISTTYKNSLESGKNNYEQDSKTSPQLLSWFAVNLEIVKSTWDPKIQDWVYEQNIIINVYDIPSVQTPYAPNKSKYYGAHKRYEHYFTGKNSEILDYQLQFNTVYFNTVLGIKEKDFKEGELISLPDNSIREDSNINPTDRRLANGTQVSPGIDVSAGTATAGGTSVRTGTMSNGDNTGSPGLGLQAQNSIVTSLQDEGTYAKGTVKIMGDPDFLIRDAAVSLTEFYNKFYETNGYTISAQGGQIFIEIAFNEAVDYKNKTGLMEINENIFFLNYPDYIKKMAKGAVIWEVTEVDSTFASGRFEQVLHLVGPAFDTGNTIPSATPATGPIADATDNADDDENTNQGEWGGVTYGWTDPREIDASARTQANIDELNAQRGGP